MKHQKRLQNKTLKLISTLNEMSALLPPTVGAVCAVRDIYEGINKLSKVMVEYNEDLKRVKKC